MKNLIYITALLAFFGCNSFSKFVPEQYFTEGSEREFATAIYNGNSRKIKKMITDNIVDLNVSGEKGFSYLLYAVFVEKYNIVKILLEHGADPNQLSIIKHPDGSIEKLTPLGCVCRNHWYPIKYIKLLVEKGANVNDTNITPLHACVGNPGKDLKRVRYLIENGANINQVFGDYTPMQRAVLGRRLDLVDLLWDYGANPLYIGKKGNSLAYMVQKIVNKKLGTPEYVAHAQAIMNRLEKLGVKFPVTITPPEKEKTTITNSKPTE